MGGLDGEICSYVEGKWERGHGGTAPASNPATGEAFATVFLGDRGDVDRAVAVARRAARSWMVTSAFERAACCDRAASLITEHRDALAGILTMDQGKPLVHEAYDEVDELASYFRLAAEDARRIAGSAPPSSIAGRQVLVQRVPLGVIGVITPWNWPYTMAAELVAPALAAGNAVIWVPAPTTSACSAALTRVIADAGFPEGVFGFVPGEGPVVGDALAAHPGLAGVGFVGSIATGAIVAQRSAGKAHVLELGGNGPMVVLDDADLELATAAALEAAYLCAGQSCTAGERFLVHSAVKEEFVERVRAATVADVRLGDPLDPKTTMGPLHNEATAAKVERHVHDALHGGARLVSGGRRAGGFPTDLFFEPTVLDGVTPSMSIAQEETFGPVIPVVEVASAAAALDLANGSAFGLTASVFTADLERGLAFAQAARFGWVNVNATTNLWEPHLPFGGRAGSVSGHGRVGGSAVFDAFTEPKTVHFPLPRLRG